MTPARRANPLAHRARGHVLVLATALVVMAATFAVVVEAQCPSEVTFRAFTNGSGAQIVSPDCNVESVFVEASDDGKKSMDASNRKIAIVESLPKVVSLNLAGNKITQMAKSDNEMINELDLTQNGLSSLENINIPRAVYNLILDGNKFTSMNEDTLSTRVTKLSLKKNDITDLSGFTFSKGVEELDLGGNPLERFFNLNMPYQLLRLSCINCGIQEFGGVVFSSNLRDLDFKDSTISMMEISNASKSVIEKLTKYLVTTSVTSCPDKKAELITIRSTRVCMLNTADFNAKYKIRSGERSTEGGGGGAVLSGDGSTAGGTSNALQYGLIGGGALVIIILVVAVFVIRRRRNNDNERDKLEFESCMQPMTTGVTRFIHGTSTLSSGSGGNGNGTVLQANEYFPNDIRSDEDIMAYRLMQSDIVRGKLIAKGGYGAVYMATFKNETVVVKQMLPEKTSNKMIIKSFMDEIRICVQLDHPKVVKFIGITWTTLHDLTVVMEYMPNGDLSTLLAEQHQREKAAKSARNGFSWFHSSAKLKCKSLIALDIAEALVYLHSFESPIIHRDLKPKNVLMGPNWEAKLTDFGISREMNEDLTMTAEIGTVSWIAPEVLRGERYSEKADVYSFGVILSELDTCRRPYSAIPSSSGGSNGHSNTRIAVLVSSGQLKPSVHRDCPRSVRNLTKRCLAFNPHDRPSAVQIHYELRHLELDDDELKESERVMAEQQQQQQQQRGGPNHRTRKKPSRRPSSRNNGMQELARGDSGGGRDNTSRSAGSSGSDRTPVRTPQHEDRQPKRNHRTGPGVRPKPPPSSGTTGEHRRPRP